jgi:DNA-binding MarR family transcriptional regulator
MSNKPNDVTAKIVIEFTRILYSALAVKYGGDRTLNELRVMNQLIRCSLKGRTCSVTGIHKATGIPIPTVSRCVANLQNGGFLCEQRDPDDGRKRLISLSAHSLQATGSDIDGMAQWFNDCREHGLPG